MTKFYAALWYTWLPRFPKGLVHSRRSESIHWMHECVKMMILPGPWGHSSSALLLQAAPQEAESSQLWEVLFSFTSKISSDIKNHSPASAPFMPRKTVDVRSLLRYLEENSSFCPLPSLHEVTESGWQSKQWHVLGLVPALIPGFSSPSLLPIFRMAYLGVDN